MLTFEEVFIDRASVLFRYYHRDFASKIETIGEIDILCLWVQSNPFDDPDRMKEVELHS